MDMKQKKNISVRQITGIVLLATAIVGIIACSIVDMAINSAFTWSLYPIVSIIFACSLIFPIIQRGKKGIMPALGVLTVAVIPYLHVLDKIAGTGDLILKVGGVISAIVLVYLWLMYLVMKLCKGRMWMGVGIAMILAAPLCVLINYSLSLTVTPEAAAFDAWDILDIVILVAGGIGLICFDFIMKRKKSDK